MARAVLQIAQADGLSAVVNCGTRSAVVAERPQIDRAYLRRGVSRERGDKKADAY